MNSDLAANTLQEWFNSPEGQKHLNSPPPKLEEVGKVLQISISGGRLIVYKVFHQMYPFQEGRGHWVFTESRSEALEWCLNVLWHATEVARPDIPIPDYLDSTERVPPVLEFPYGSNPFTGDPVVKYGVLKVGYGGVYPWCWFFEPAWMDTKEQAELELQSSISELEKLRYSITVQTEHDVLIEAVKSASRKWKPFLLHRLLAMKASLDHLLATDPSKHTFNSEPDDLRAHNVRIREAFEGVQKAYKDASEHHVRVVREKGVVDRLRAAFKTVSVCPLCEEQLQLTDDWLGELALAGSASLPCYCPIPRENPYLKGIRETVVEGVSLAPTRVVFDGCSPVLTIGGLDMSRVVVHFEALCGSDLKNLVCRDLTRDNIDRVRKQRLEIAEMGVREGTVLLLKFRYDSHRNRWSTKKNVDGKTVIYSVDSKCPLRVVADVEYYCRIVSIPQGARRPDFELVIVNPYIEK